MSECKKCTFINPQNAESCQMCYSVLDVKHCEDCKHIIYNFENKCSNCGKHYNCNCMECIIDRLKQKLNDSKGTFIDKFITYAKEKKIENINKTQLTHILSKYFDYPLFTSSNCLRAFIRFTYDIAERNISKDEKKDTILDDSDTESLTIEQDVKQSDTESLTIEQDVKQSDTESLTIEQDVKQSNTKSSTIEQDVKQSNENICIKEEKKKDIEINFKYLYEIVRPLTIEFLSSSYDVSYLELRIMEEVSMVKKAMYTPMENNMLKMFKSLPILKTKEHQCFCADDSSDKKIIEMPCCKVKVHLKCTIKNFKIRNSCPYCREENFFKINK